MRPLEVLPPAPVVEVELLTAPALPPATASLVFEHLFSSVVPANTHRKKKTNLEGKNKTKKKGHMIDSWSHEKNGIRMYRCVIGFCSVVLQRRAMYFVDGHRLASRLAEGDPARTRYRVPGAGFRAMQNTQPGLHG